ncbi:MAG TPA: hypothetical protein VNB54_06875 [Alphaproteobacteria bacterium]|nr:hypothetical protein [Alphaproteobacteria bacterium]
MANVSRLALLLALLAFARASFSLTHADEIPSAEELVQAFQASAGTASIVPYRLSAKLTLTPDKNVSIAGQVAYARDKDRSRIEITAGDYHEIRVVLGDRIYVNGSQKALPRRTNLESLESLWTGIFSRVSCCAAFSQVEKKKIEGVNAYCFTMARQNARPRRICLAREDKTVLETYDGFEKISFLQYRTLEGFRYPSHIQIVDDGKPFLEILDLAMQQGAPAESFTAPQDARIFESCADQESEQPLQMTMPRVPSRWHSSYATVYAVVQVDGSLTDVQVEVSRADENFVRALKEVTAQWRFAPATCGGKAVAVEMQLEIHN